MSKYTTELRFICENYAGLAKSEGYNNINTVISNALPKLFDFDFPIYDEDYRSVLETKIVKHYYTREICAETVGRWKLFLNERLNLIMPYYNERYKSAMLDFNPLYDQDITIDHTKGNEGNSANSQNTSNNGTNNRTYNRSDDYTRNLNTSTNGTSTDNNWTYNNDTPQGGITGLESGNYLTSATHDVNNGTDNSTTAQTGNDNRKIEDTDNTSLTNTGETKANANYTDTETYLEHIKGKSAGTSYSKLLEEYRNTIINVDNEIIDNLADLFFNLY